MIKSYNINRTDLDDYASDPASAAMEIHRQLGFATKALDLDVLASALGITEIRYEPNLSFEGMLIAPLEKGEGKILINASSDKKRQRFTLAHELGHYIIPSHVQTNSAGFYCFGKDLDDQNTSVIRVDEKHIRQEQEANQFATELLMPMHLIEPYLAHEKPLQGICSLASKAKVSIAASARRFASLTDRAMIVLFSQNGVFSYCRWSKKITSSRLCQGVRLPLTPRTSSNMTERAQVSPSLWGFKDTKYVIYQQTIYLNRGYEITVIEVI